MRDNTFLDEAIRAQGAGRALEAAELYRHVLKYDPDHPVALNNLGLLLAEMRQYAQSEELLQRLARLAPRHADAHVNLAVVLQDQQKFDEAIASCRQALQLSPDHRQALNTLASVLAAAGKYDEASALLGKIIQKRPGYAKGYAFLGTICAKQGKLEEAVRNFGRAAQLDPKDDVSLVAAGECLLIAGKAEEALGYLDRALRVNAYDVRGLALKTLALADTGKTTEEKWLADPERLIHTHHIADFGYGHEALAALNRGLAEFAAGDPGMREDPVQYATYKGWHSTTNIADAPNPAIEALKKFVTWGFEQRLKTLPQEDPAHPFARSAPKDFRLDLWSVRLRGGGGKMVPHIHTDGWLSGVYYVDIPGVVNDPGAGHAGWIKFGTPRIDIRLAREPLTRSVKPRPGLLITFPSYFWHDTVPLPVENDEQRLCYSFDFQPIR